MNENAAASLRAIRRALPFDPPGMLLLFSVFGSQVRGTETPLSDLDVLYVAREKSKLLHDTVRRTIRDAPGGIKSVSIFTHTPETLRKYANLYGTVEYDVLRGIGEVKTLYRAESFELDGILMEPSEADFGRCARQWLRMSEKIIAEAEVIPELAPGFTCVMIQKAIDCLLRACLMSAGIRFPFTRGMGALHGMLPPERRMPIDIDTLEHWANHVDYGSDGRGGTQFYTKADAAEAARMAREAYNFTKDIVSTLR